MTPYQEQLEAIKRAAASGRGCIVMPTGFGKSITMALLINELQVKTLIVVPNLTLKHQLRDAFTKYFGSLDNITIENVDSPELWKRAYYDCVIIDEAHHVAASTYQKLNRKMWGGIYWRFFFTATPFRSKEEEHMLYESIAGQVIYRVTYETAVEKAYIVPIEAYYIDLPTTEPEGNTGSWPAMYSELVVNNGPRNEIIATLLNNLKEAGTSVLCLIKEIKHGKTLQDASGVPFANGEDGEARALIDAFNKGNTALIGTVGVIGEGVDTKPCEYVILAGGGKAKTQFMQNVGRGVRRYGDKATCKVILFRDASHKWTLTHFKEQCKILRDEYGVEVVKLEI